MTPYRTPFYMPEVSNSFVGRIWCDRCGLGVWSCDEECRPLSVPMLSAVESVAALFGVDLTRARTSTGIEHSFVPMMPSPSVARSARESR